MKTVSPVFEANLQTYLDQLKKIPLDAVIERLGGRNATLPFLGNPHAISPGGIVDAKGRRARYEVCIVLFRHLIMCPPEIPQEREWVSFKDLKGAGPLTVYFRDNAEAPLIQAFGDDPKALKAAAKALGGSPPDLDLQYDVALVVQALPKIPLLLLFNGADGEFPAECSILFERRVESFIDPACIAILGHCLAQGLMV